MRNLTILFVLLLFVQTLFAQVQDEKYAVRLRNAAFVPEENVKDFKKKRSDELLPFKIDNNYYVVLQFEEIPDAAMKERIAASGIKLYNYLPNYSFLAKVPEAQLSQLKKYDVRSVFGLEDWHKAGLSLDDPMRLPKYAIKEAGFADVNIRYYPEFDVDYVVAELEKIGINVLKTSADFHNARLRVEYNKLQELANLAWVAWVEPIEAPQVTDNFQGRINHRSYGLKYGALPLTGAGVSVGLWDTDTEPHIDFGSRLTTRETGLERHPHGMHTAGTIGSSGLGDPKARGMAPDAKIFAWNFGYGANGLDTHEEMILEIESSTVNAVVTSHSYGAKLGDKDTYTTSDQARDQLSYDYPYVTQVTSSGNYGDETPDGYYTTTKMFKNELVVGNLDSDDVIAPGSSRGPTFDGRLIPQISAIGTAVYSCNYNNDYMLMGGTSMATPGVAGVTAQLYQLVREKTGGQNPTSALMRAVLCNTAEDLGNPGPDYIYGYGRVNGLRAARIIENENTHAGAMENNGKTSVSINVGTAGDVAELRVMLAWTDVAPTNLSGKLLVNDLDLVVTDQTNDVEYLPFVLDYLNPSADAVRGVDKLNNLEQVVIKNPTGPYAISIKGSEIPKGPQAYTVVWEVVYKDVEIVYPIGGDVLNGGSEATIRWDAAGGEGNFVVEFSTDGGQTYEVLEDVVVESQLEFEAAADYKSYNQKRGNEIVIDNSNIGSSKRHTYWNVPNIYTNNAKLKITQGDLEFETEAFSIIPAPKNIQLETCGNPTLTWDAFSDADSYNVYVLDGSTWLPALNTTDANIELTTLDERKDYYVALTTVINGVESEKTDRLLVRRLLDVNTFPFFEDFETGKSEYFRFNKGDESDVFIKDREGNKVVHFTGGWYEDWDFQNRNGFEQPKYISNITTCKVDATSLTNGLLMSFDMRVVTYMQKHFANFRLLVNGQPVADKNGTVVFTADALLEAEKNQGDETPFDVDFNFITYDLSAFANQEFELTFEASCLFSSSMYWDVKHGSFVEIDNIILRELPEYDLAIQDIKPLVSGTKLTKQNVTINLFNQGSEPAEGFALELTANGVTYVERPQIILDSEKSIEYTFENALDLREPDTYNVEVKINWDKDNFATNDVVKTQVTNYGELFAMGQGETELVANGFLFTDDGGPNGPYSDPRYPKAFDGVVTFYPEKPGQRVQIDFDYFITQKWIVIGGNNYWADRMVIYNGNSTNAEPIGYYVTTRDIGLIQSTAPDGSLTVSWHATYYGFDSDPYDGWEAYVSSFTPPSYDLSITEITTPNNGELGANEPITVEVTNLGVEAVKGYSLIYSINGGENITETIYDLLNPGETLIYTFKQTADLSDLGDYTIKVQSYLNGDENYDNDEKVKEVVCHNYCLPTYSDAKEYIKEVKIADLVNNTGLSQGGYGQYDDMVASLTIGQTHNLMVKVDNMEHLDRCFAWVDWNNDGQFTLNERTKLYKGIAAYFSGGVKVPADVALGDYRMRIRLAYNEDVSPCGDTEFGEAEDYTVRVLSNNTNINEAWLYTALNSPLVKDIRATIFKDLILFEIPKGIKPWEYEVTFAVDGTIKKYEIQDLFTFESLKVFDDFQNIEVVNFKSQRKALLVKVTAQDGTEREYKVIFEHEESPSSIGGDVTDQIAVYPNPVKDVITVVNAAGSDMQIIDLTGKVVKTKKANSQIEKISIQSLSAGTYLLRMTNNNNVITKKIEVVK